MSRFLPKDFVYGGATAAYQAEGSTKVGNKGRVAWDSFLEKEGRFSPDPASDFYNKYDIDLDLCKEFGINGIRISIAWSRIFPNGYRTPNVEGVKFYHNLFRKCSENKIEPLVTLHHFDTPETLHSNGDFLNRDNINHFVNYAKFCFDEFGEEVKKWATFNEIWPVSSGQYLIGKFPPGISFDYTKVVQSMHNMMVAHGKVINLFNEFGFDGEIGIIHSLETKYPYRNCREDELACNKADVFCNKFLLEATFNGFYSEETLNVIKDILELNNGDFEISDDDIEIMKMASSKNDFLGINYYQSNFVKFYDGENEVFHNGTGDKGTSVYRLKGIGEYMFDVDIPRTDWDWLIYPKGLYDMIMRIKNNYPNYKKLFVTENGMGYKDVFENGIINDEPRIDYIKAHLNEVARAIEDGANVKGYYVWSLMDLFSWTNGYDKRYGLFYVDFETQKRYPKKSAYWFKKISASGEIL